MNKTFVTIVPHIENLELRKDTGQIPYHFYKTLGYDATLVSYFYTLKGGREAGPVTNPPTNKLEIEKNYPYLNTEVPGLKIHFLQNLGRGKFYEKTIYSYVKNNAKNITILNLFHLTAENIFYSLLYKFYNPKGKIYLKLDIDIAYYQTQKNIFNTNSVLGKIKKQIYSFLLLPLFFKLVHIISAESDAGLDYFTNRYKLSAKKILLIPNGVDSERLATIVPHRLSLNEKENIIISVGRIGNSQKNHSLLLNALTKIDLKDWKVYFVGPIAVSFKSDIENFKQQHPQLVNKVMFTGLIDEPEKLYQLYNRSKIFCMPSLWEGFPLAAVEAAHFGNVLLLSEEIYAFNTLSNFGLGGEKFSTIDDKQLSNLLTKYINEPKLLAQKQEQILTHAVNNFEWAKIVKKIDAKLC